VDVKAGGSVGLGDWRGQKARQPPAGQARRGQRTEAVTRARSSA
jgi:hypothetical protein